MENEIDREIDGTDHKIGSEIWNNERGEGYGVGVVTGEENVVKCAVI